MIISVIELKLRTFLNDLWNDFKYSECLEYKSVDILIIHWMHEYSVD